MKGKTIVIDYVAFLEAEKNWLKLARLLEFLGLKEWASRLREKVKIDRCVLMYSALRRYGFSEEEANYETRKLATIQEEDEIIYIRPVAVIYPTPKKALKAFTETELREEQKKIREMRLEISLPLNGAGKDF